MKIKCKKLQIFDTIVSSISCLEEYKEINVV